MNIERTTLPGIGVRHTFTTEEGRRIGIVEYRAGDRRDVIQDDPDDPDRVVSLRLTRAEAITLANLLGFPDLVVAASMAEPG